MELMQFFDRIEAAADLEGVGLDTCAEARPGVVIKHVPTGLLTRLPVEAVERADWTVLEEVLVGKREPQVLQHMTRVVGYFSRVENWNRSKIGELKDRHRGDYAVSVPDGQRRGA